MSDQYYSGHLGSICRRGRHSWSPGPPGQETYIETCLDCGTTRLTYEAMQTDLAAYKAALADVVGTVARYADFWAEAKPEKGTDPAITKAVNTVANNIASLIRSLAPPAAAPYAKVLEAARRYDEARIARPLLYAKKRAEDRSLDNLTITYLREADEPLEQAQADLHEALAAIEDASQRAILADRAAERARLAQSGDVEEIAAEIIAILGIRLAGGIAPEPVIALSRHVQAKLAATAEAARIEARNICTALIVGLALEIDKQPVVKRSAEGAAQDGVVAILRTVSERLNALRPDELEKKT